jgi:hypothetical protein
VALIPVAFVLATAVGEGLISAAGYPSGGEDVAPLGLALVIGLPVSVLAALPALAAVRYGLGARRAGRRSGLVPTAIGGIVLCYWLAALVLFPFSR